VRAQIDHTRRRAGQLANALGRRVVDPGAGEVRLGPADQPPELVVLEARGLGFGVGLRHHLPQRVVDITPGPEIGVLHLGLPPARVVGQRGDVARRVGGGLEVAERVVGEGGGAVELVLRLHHLPLRVARLAARLGHRVGRGGDQRVVSELRVRRVGLRLLRHPGPRA